MKTLRNAAVGETVVVSKVNGEGSVRTYSTEPPL